VKAQVFYKPEVMKLEDRDIPAVSDNEVLIRVKACGICGSDIAYYFGKSPLDTETGLGPLVLGHEFSGDIVEMGTNVERMGMFHASDRVTVNPPLHCNVCEMCTQGYPNLCLNMKPLGTAQNGAFAEYVKAPYTHLVKLPDAVSYEEAAMIEPLACALHGVKLLDAQLGDSVVIFGTGAIGLMMLQAIKARGAGKVAVCGVLDYPLETARHLGADYIFNTMDNASPYYTNDIKKEIISLTGGRMADKSIVPVGAVSAMRSAVEVTGFNANIVMFGLPGADDVLEVPVLDTLKAAKTVRFSWLSPQMWPETIRAVHEGKIQLRSLITHHYTLEQLGDALVYLAGPDPKKIKGMVLF
jgi:L-iditol 2-dehydrogenase